MNENIKKFVQLIQDNPTLSVKVKVDTRLNSVGEISNPMIHEYYNDDGRIYLDDEILEYFQEKISWSPGYEGLSNEESMNIANALYDIEVNIGNIKAAIFVDVIT